MKILASDFDGTIYFRNENPCYHQEDIEAILKFQRAGHKFGLCTGRPLNGILPNSSDAFKFDFYILNSGAVLIDGDLNVIMKKTISQEILEDVFSKYSNYPLFFTCDEGIFINKEHGHFKGNKIPLVNSAKDLENYTVTGFSFHPETEKEASKILEMMKDYEDLSCFQNKEAVDCVAKGCSKATGIQLLKEYYGIKDRDVACIGDSYNDMPMLSGVEESYTFVDSPEVVKAVAKYHVHSVNECIRKMMDE